MITYAETLRHKHWPVSVELMAQYRDGSYDLKSFDGVLFWHQTGQLHRNDDKPAQIRADNSLSWWKHGSLHRDGDLPAWISADGTLAWWQRGQRHRFCGPAIIRADGTLAWWINDKNITQAVNQWLNGEEWQGTPLQIFEFQLRFV